MKCNNCNGKGEVLNLTISEYGGSCEYIKCTECGGTGIVGMTNEEWLCQLSTEEKAECITNISFNTGYDSYNFVLQKVVEWLKQPHNN